jgi:hypothetical protein
VEKGYTYAFKQTNKSFVYEEKIVEERKKPVRVYNFN